MSEVRVLPVAGLPEIAAGDALGELIATRAELEDGDVVVVSQKVVSKAEGQGATALGGGPPEPRHGV